ncbi:hypothetical protein K435DRAFT_796432 [Dendrothele bispora CBS 962.96]|uniref:Uncharacterized protein n=1 Tax=Dendrothele bispora (strain CBS 962.96) TaxID=1314807 RepID=A0A4S8M6Y6_DENBC|nr:hypothetical protein K435DRAFT_796432 [Dendrothele bispora CBS 962.96]
MSRYNTGYSLFIAYNLPSTTDVLQDDSKNFIKDLIIEESSEIILFGLYVLAKYYSGQSLQRCYKVWGAKKKIIVLPVFISIINNDSFTMERLVNLEKYTFRSFLAVNFLTNLVIPFMIAGRIWWIGNQVSKFLPSRKFNLARHTMAICLESGIMYPLALLPSLVLTFQPVEIPAFLVNFIPILIQIVGIAPTFIIDTIRMNEENGQRDQVVLSMWDADHNIDEHVQKERSIV